MPALTSVLMFVALGFRIVVLCIKWLLNNETAIDVDCLRLDRKFETGQEV